MPKNKLCRVGLITEEIQMSDMLKTVTDQSFEAEVLNSSLPVLVDYSAEWCGPCKMVGPIVEASAKQYAGRLSVAKLDIDSSPRTPSRYNVRGIPTLMLFKDGQPVATHVGSLSKAQLTTFIDKHVPSAAANAAPAVAEV
jgi:thioredoxin 1